MMSKVSFEDRVIGVCVDSFLSYASGNYLCFAEMNRNKTVKFIKKFYPDWQYVDMSQLANFEFKSNYEGVLFDGKIPEVCDPKRTLELLLGLYTPSTSVVVAPKFIQSESGNCAVEWVNVCIGYGQRVFFDTCTFKFRFDSYVKMYEDELGVGVQNLLDDYKLKGFQSGLERNIPVHLI